MESIDPNTQGYIVDTPIETVSANFVAAGLHIKPVAELDSSELFIAHYLAFDELEGAEYEQGWEFTMRGDGPDEHSRDLICEAESRLFLIEDEMKRRNIFIPEWGSDED
jgi:hypothetical protein